MFALLSLVVCLAAQPAICETVTPDYVHQDTGERPTLFECLGSEARVSRASGSTSTQDIFWIGTSALPRMMGIACAIRSRLREPEASRQSRSITALAPQ